MFHFILFKKKNLFLYLFLATLDFRCFEGFSLVAAREDCSLLQCKGFSLLWPLLLGSTGFRALGPQQLQHTDSGVTIPGPRAQAQQLRHSGLGALWHAGSSWTGDRTWVFCTDRQILDH